MTSRWSLSSYSPLPFLGSAAELGLIEREVVTPLGPAVIRHSRERKGAVALVLVHGAAGSWTTWTPLLTAARLSGSPLADVVAIDLPGWGSTTGRLSGRGLTLDAVAASVLACVEAAGYRSWRIVGHSMGGLIALHTALRYPEATQSVGLISPTAWAVGRSAQRPWHRLLRSLRSPGEVPAFALLYLLLRALAPAEPAVRLLVRALDAVGLLRLLAAPLFAHPLRLPPSVPRSVSADLRPRSFVLAVQLIRGYDASALWPDVACPVYWVSGNGDVFVGSRDLAQLAVALPASHRTVLQECGHYAHVEWPLKTLAALDLLPLPRR